MKKFELTPVVNLLVLVMIWVIIFSMLEDYTASWTQFHLFNIMGVAKIFALILGVGYRLRDYYLNKKSNESRSENSDSGY